MEAFNRHFPYGLSLEPIQARSVAIVTRCAPPPASGAWTILRIFLPAAPLSEFYHRNTQLPGFLTGLRVLYAQTFLPATSILAASGSYSPHRATTGGGNASRSMRSRIAENNLRVTATSANWNVTYFACRVTFAPILTSFSRSVVSDQCFIS